jgi:3,4-dihydroxy 2-butanone 4-phosphate synthase/GTP cyclohydrolase II
MLARTQSAVEIAPVAEIMQELRAGCMVILVDDEQRENEGDFVLAAQFVSAEAINFMARYGRGLICLSMTEARCRQLNLRPMVADNRSQHGTNFTASIEAATGVATGISAADRARTVQVAVADDSGPEDLVQPGHIFPLIAQPGGVLVRAGHTEAGCDLTQLAGLKPAAVICEILNEDGSMARLPDLQRVAAAHQLKMGTIADLIHYRSATERLVTRVGDKPCATAYGEFRLVAFRETISGVVHFALCRGEIRADIETLVRVHKPLSALDFLEISDHAGKSFRLGEALARVARAERGVVVLLHGPEEPAEQLRRFGIGGEETLRRRWDPRSYGIGAQILRDLGVGKMRLLGAARKLPSMAGFDLEITGFETRAEVGE